MMKQKSIPTGEPRDAFTSLFRFITASPSHPVGLAVFWTGRQVTGRTFVIFIALAFADVREAGTVARASQVVMLTWTRINARKFKLYFDYKKFSI